MSRWIVPNMGSVVLILGSNDDAVATRMDKSNLLQALECAAKAGQLRGDLDRFRVLLASHIELERELIEADPKVVYG